MQFSIKGIVAFCTLMQGDGGILTKSPGYIMEKFGMCFEETNFPLDLHNQAVYQSWLDLWWKRLVHDAAAEEAPS